MGAVRKLGAIIATAAAAAALLVAAAAAGAETITVTRTDDRLPGLCQPTDCTLREAVAKANLTAELDEVVLPASDQPYTIGPGMSWIEVTKPLLIRGDGADRTVVKGNGEHYVFLLMGEASPTALRDLTIRDGKGAIQNNAALTLRRVAIVHNTRPGAGGGVQTNGPLTVESSYFGHNATDGSSGSAIHANGLVKVVNSTFAFNSGKAAAVAGNAGVEATASAFVNNIAATPGNGALSGSTLTVRDNILAGNSTPASNCKSLAPIVSLGGNVEDGASCAIGPADRPGVNPLLGTLALHGGPTLVYDLLPDSPAIDAATQCLPFDQRGVPRPQGGACDSGPYELVPAPPPPAPAAPQQLVGVPKGKLRLTRGGAVVVRLRCLLRASVRCEGKLTLRTRSKVRFGGKRRVVRLAPAKSFRIAAGRVKALRVKLPRAKAALVRELAAARKVRLVVTARDAAGAAPPLTVNRAIAPTR